jgi:GSCFA family
MIFTTKIPISKSKNSIDYNSRIVSIGSCFAENMADKFDYFKFQNLVNPFGIIFNVVSIERIVERIVNSELFTEKDIFYHNELWHCFEVHSSISNPDKDVFLTNLNLLVKQSNNLLIELSHCIITFGTSWVYRNTETNQIVANCHKIPQKQFSKELLSTEITQKSIESTIALIQSINKDVKFIFTVSPVRHIKDGFVENNVSKAILLQSVYNVVNSNTGVPPLGVRGLFPSYEIILDELRDYRFYKDDMLHPNQIAIDYVWERFCETYFSDEINLIMNQVGAIQKMINHKPINPNSNHNKDLKEKIQEKTAKLQLEYPQIIF